MLRDKRGITLISLVVTVIILLILAGATIAGIMGDNSVVDKAKRSADGTKYKIAEQEVNEEYYMLMLDDDYFMDYNLQYQMEVLVNSLRADYPDANSREVSIDEENKILVVSHRGFNISIDTTTKGYQYTPNPDEIVYGSNIIGGDPGGGPGGGNGGGTGGNGNTSYANQVSNQTDPSEEDPNAEITYYISYELNGGYFEGENAPTTYTNKTPAFTIPNPKKENTTFRGWSGIGIQGIVDQIVIPTGSTGNKIYVANWNTPSFQIVNPDGTNSTKYTLKEALAEAQDGATIKALANVLESERIDEINKNITIDLQGKTIILNTSMVVGVAGNVTIIDNGDTVTGELAGRISSMSEVAIINNGELNIGNDDGNVLFFPYIVGRQYGISSPYANINFYDGTITGIKGINGTRVVTPTNYFAMADKNGDGTESVSLRVLGKTIAKIDFNYFSDLQTAVTSTAPASQSGTMQTTLKNISADMVQYDLSENYFFYTSGDSVMSNNLGVNNSRAYGYFKIDLSQSSTDYLYKISFKGTISSEANCDVGYAYITNSPNKPDIASATDQIMKISGTVMDRDGSKMVSGGGVYYLHLFYTKDRSAHTGSDTFTISDLHVQKYSGEQNLGEEKILIQTNSANLTAARIVLVADAVVSSTVVIDSTKNIVLDLNGHVINTVGNINTFNNYGKLRITDSSPAKTGRIVNSGTYAILSDGSITLENLTMDYTAITPGTSYFIRAFSGNYTVQGCTFKTNNNYKLIYNSTGVVTVQNCTFQTENDDNNPIFYTQGLGTTTSRNNVYDSKNYALQNDAGTLMTSGDTAYRGYAKIMGSSIGFIDGLNASQKSDWNNLRLIWIATTSSVDIKNVNIVPYDNDKNYYAIRVDNSTGTINLQNVVVPEVITENNKQYKRALEINEFTGTITIDSQTELPYIWTGGGSNKPAGYVNGTEFKNAYRFWCEASNLVINMEAPKSVGWIYNNSNITINNANIPKHIENRRTMTITNSSIVQDVNNAFHNNKYYEAINNSGTITIVDSDLQYLQSPWNTTLKGIQNTGTVYVQSNGQKPMTINGLNYGIYNEGGRVILGTKDGIYNENMEIKGNNTTGIYSTTTASTQIFDGIITGPTAITGTITDLEIGFGLDVNVEQSGFQVASLIVWEDTVCIVETGEIYNSLRDAVEAIQNSNPATIRMLKDYRHVVNWTIPEDRNIILDLNGKQLTINTPIVNNGNFKVIDSSEAQNGAMNMLARITNNSIMTVSSGIIVNKQSGNSSTRNSIVYNNGTLNIEGGTIKTADSDIAYTTVICNNAGTVNMTGGNVYAGYTSGNYLRSFENLNGGTLNISGGYIRGTSSGSAYNGYWHQLIYNAGYSIVNITGGELYSGSNTSSCIYGNGSYDERTDSRAQINISNAKITFAGYSNYGEGSAIFLNAYDNLTLNNVTIDSAGYGIRDGNNNQIKDKFVIDSDIVASRETFILRKGTAHFTGGRVGARGEQAAILLYNGGVAQINGATFYCYNNGTGIQLEESSRLDFYSGNIEKVNVGIAINSGTVNYGDKNTEVSLETPIITANTNGINVSGSGNLNFYDGMVKGRSNAVSGSVNQKAYQYTVFADTETIDELVYKRNYLAKIYVIENVDTGIQYTSLVEAVSDIEDYGSLKYIFTAAESDAITIQTNQTIIIDLNAQSVTTTARITNRGTLTFKDTSESKSGKYINGKSGDSSNRNVVIYNYGILNIESGTIKTSDSGISYTTVICNNGGMVSMTSGNVYAGYTSGNYLRAFENLNGGTLNISGGYIRGTSSGSAYNGYWHQLIYNAGYSIVNITGGELYSGSNTSSCIYGNGSYEERLQNRAEINISNAKITFAGYSNYGEGSAIFLNAYDNLTLNNVTIDSAGYGIRDGNNNQTKDKFVIDSDIVASRETFILRKGTAHITGGQIGARGDQAAILLYNGGIVELNNASFYCYSRGTGIQLEESSRVDFKSGYIEKVNVGIAINSGTVNYGVNDADVTLETPLIEASGTGISKTGSGVFNFYDGMIKGNSVAMSGNIDYKPEGYEIIDDTQDGYARRYLGQFEVVENVTTGIRYNTLAEAINECVDGDNELKILYNTNLTSPITIESTKHIIFDLDGKTVNTSRQIINYGTLTFKDTSNNKSGKYINGKSGVSDNRNVAIYNYGELNIQSGTIKTADSGISYTTVICNNNGIINMTGGNVYAGYTSGNYLRAFENLNGGTLNISGGYIRGTSSGSAYNGYWHQLIYNAGYSVVNITGGELYSGSNTSSCIYGNGSLEQISQARAKINISNAKITFAGYSNYGEGSAIFLNAYDNLTLDNVTINSTGYGIRDGNNNQTKDKIITDCEIIASNREALIIRQGETHITDTTIYSTLCLALYNTSNTTLDNVRILNVSNSGTGIAVYDSGTILTINNSEITRGLANITGATGIRVDTSSIVQANSLTMENFATGVWILSSATFRLGTQGGEVDITQPIIIGNACGIKNESGKFYFYDGVIKSKGTSITGNVTGTETDYIVDSADDEEGYHNATLVSNASGDGRIVYAMVTQSGSTRNYYSIQEAIEACTIGGEIVTLVRASDLGMDVLTVREEQNLTINLNGWNIRSAASSDPAITNYGFLQVKDSSGSNGKIESTLGTGIANNGTLNIGLDDGTVNSSGSTKGPGIIGLHYGIDNQGTLNFYDGYIKGTTAVNGNSIENSPQTYVITSDGGSPETVSLLRTTMTVEYTVEDDTIHILATNVTHMLIPDGQTFQKIDAINSIIDYDYVVPENGEYMIMLCDTNNNYKTIVVEVTTVPGDEPPTNTIGNDTNTIGDDTNTIGDDTNTIGDNTNTVGDDTNTTGDDTNTVGDDTNTTVSP